MAARGQVPEGKYTSSVYTWIMEGRYQDVIDLLTMQLQYTPDNRAALSLLGYANFQVSLTWKQRIYMRVFIISNLICACNVACCSPTTILAPVRFTPRPTTHTGWLLWPGGYNVQAAVRYIPRCWGVPDLPRAGTVRQQSRIKVFPACFFYVTYT